MGEEDTQGASQSQTRRRYTVQEAAEALGVSVEALRGRIKRGTIAHEREGERVYVLLDTDQPAAGRDQDADHPPDQPQLVDELRARVEDLREQLAAEREANKENRRIIAALTSRIPQLEPPREAQNEPERPAERRSWWRRWFGA